MCMASLTRLLPPSLPPYLQKHVFGLPNAPRLEEHGSSAVGREDVGMLLVQHVRVPIQRARQEHFVFFAGLEVLLLGLAVAIILCVVEVDVAEHDGRVPVLVVALQDLLQLLLRAGQVARRRQQRGESRVRIRAVRRHRERLAVPDRCLLVVAARLCDSPQAQVAVCVVWPLFQPGRINMRA